MWFDLSQPFFDGMPHASILDPPAFETVRSVADDGVNVQRYAVPTHVGTHVDAPMHFVEDGETIDELPLERCCGEAVVLDVSGPEPAEITLDDVEGCEGTVTPDDVVLLHTGWGSKYGTEGYDPHPWLSVEVAEWLVEREVKLVGIDAITPELPVPFRPSGWTEHPVHRTLLGGGVLVAEHLANLGPHAGTRIEVQAFPVNIRGGDGAPARIVGRRIPGGNDGQR